MKNITTILLFFVFCSNLCAQNYVPFPTSNAVWRGNYADWSGLGITGYWWQYNQTISGDTLINGVLYHNLEETTIQEEYNLQPWYLISSTFLGTHYVGAFREDSTRRIYFWRGGFPSEDLIYDFNLSEGDSFVNILSQGYYLHIISIDSFFDGSVFRKKYSYSCTPTANCIEGYLIEGIGSTTGFPFFLLPGLEETSELYCFRENNIIKYTDSVNSCSLVGEKEIQTIKNLFIVYPNPTASVVNLKSNQPLNFPLSMLLTDMQGKLICQKNIFNESDLFLNVKSFANGEYLLAIKNKERIVFREIFTKE